MNEWFKGERIATFGEIKRWQDCGRLCTADPKCLVWYWTSPLYGLNEREWCRLYSTHTHTESRGNAISGVRGCVE